jgi:hypothetical protein
VVNACSSTSCANGTLERQKACWIVRGDSQRPGVDFGETFTPIVKPATMQTVLGLVMNKHWTANQLDVSNAFLHGHLQEKVYCRQPIGFEDPTRPDAVCSSSVRCMDFVMRPGHGSRASPTM